MSKVTWPCTDASQRRFSTLRWKLFLFYIPFMQKKKKRCLKNVFQYCAVEKQSLFHCVCAQLQYYIRLVPCLCMPTLTSTSITVGYIQPTTRNRYTKQLLVLSGGMRGKVRMLLQGPCVGTASAGRVEITATQERPIAQRLRSSKRRWEQWVWIPLGKGGI